MAGEATPWRTHSWGVPTDRLVLEMAGMVDMELWVDENDYIRGRMTFRDEEAAAPVVERLVADGWHYDEEEGAWVK